MRRPHAPVVAGWLAGMNGPLQALISISHPGEGEKTWGRNLFFFLPSCCSLLCRFSASGAERTARQCEACGVSLARINRFTQREEKAWKPNWHNEMHFSQSASRCTVPPLSVIDSANQAQRPLLHSLLLLTSSLWHWQKAEGEIFQPQSHLWFIF